MKLINIPATVFAHVLYYVCVRYLQLKIIGYSSIVAELIGYVRERITGVLCKEFSDERKKEVVMEQSGARWRDDSIGCLIDSSHERLSSLMFRIITTKFYTFFENSDTLSIGYKILIGVALHCVVYFF